MAKRKRVTNPENLEERRIFARKLIRAGKSRTVIQDELVTNFGMGLGAVWLNEEIRHMKAVGTAKEEKPVKRRRLIDARLHKAMQAADALAIPIPPDSRLVSALLAAKQPFEFDGHQLRLL